MNDIFAGILTEKPIDGRPLHAYRVSETEFDDLRLKLRNLLASNQNKSAAAFFVLWASEKYRRDFDGGAFSWSFLTDALSLNLDQSHLRDMTRIGLKAFKRPPPHATEAGNTQYLRTIAAEGGIPVQLLSSQGGYRAALVGLIADLSRFGLGCPQEQAMSFAARRTARLPLGYRTLEFRELFLRFAREVLELRALAPHALAPDQVEGWLDRERPGWREELSLRLDEDSARSLLSEAVAVTHRTELHSEPLKRVLTRSDDDAWQSWIEVEDEAQIPSQLLHGIEPNRTRLRLGPVGDLASVAPDLMLSLDRSPNEALWSCKRISAKRTRAFHFPLGRQASFMAMADGRFMSQVELPGGAAVDKEAGLSLWLLSEMGEDKARKLDYAGTATLSTQDPHVWALVGFGMEPKCTDELIAEPDGKTELGDLWRLSGKGRVLVSDWNVSITTDAERSDRDEIFALGPVEPAILDSKGAAVFRGLPEILHRRAGRHFKSLNAREMRFRSGKLPIWRNRPPDDPFLGRLSIAAREGEGIGPRLSVNVVPKNVVISDSTIAGTHERTLTLSGLPAYWTLQVEGGGITRTNDQGVTSLELPPESLLKDRLTLTLAGPEGAPPLSWSLVLPRRRAEFVGRDGGLLTSDHKITLHDLRDWRIIPATNILTHLRIRLVGSGSSAALAIAVAVPGELPLSSFRSILEEILSLGGPDAELRIRALSGAEQSKRLILRRFLGDTTIKGTSVEWTSRTNTDDQLQIMVSAVDMNDPDRVEEVESDAIDKLGEGQWFLLPTSDGHPLRPPRPYVAEALSNRGNDQPAATSTRHNRVNNFAEAFASSVADEELTRLIKLISVFFEHGASPASLDQTLALGHVPHVAVSLLYRAAPQDLGDLLGLEMHGGPRWIFVSPKDWGTALKHEFQSLQGQFSNVPALADVSENLSYQQLQRRTQDILALRPELSAHVAIALLTNGLATPADLPKWLGAMPPGLSNSAAALLTHANRVAQRHGAQAIPLHDLRAREVPDGMEQFHPDLRGLIEAPIFTAEIAFGLRPQPTSRQMIELLQAIHTDPGAFETALPPAMAWQFSRQNT